MPARLHGMKLRDCLTLPVEHKWGDRIDTPVGNLYYRDNGATVLGVAHLDSVAWEEPTKKGRMVHAPQLDDRLGVWVLLGLLPRYGIHLDILLTDLEERGQSTAQWFDPLGGRYNWIAEFDRKGDDVVLYQYDCPEYRRLLSEYGFQTGWGSFSDISDLEHLGVTAFNFGIGYYLEHTLKCYADLKVTEKAVTKFAKFYSDLKDEHLEFKGESDGYWESLEDYSDDFWVQREYDYIQQIANNFGYQDVDEFIEQGGLQYC